MPPLHMAVPDNAGAGAGAAARPLPTVFCDFDGCLVAQEMPHAVYAFLSALPDPWQRRWKQLCFWPWLLPTAVINSILGEKFSVRLLGWIALRGVKVADARMAAQAITDSAFHATMRPNVLAKLRGLQGQGHTVAILSGNLQPLLEPVARTLNFHCISSVPEMSPCGTVYTGRLYSPCVRHEKAERVTRVQTELSERQSVKEIEVHGLGNSHNDINFLEIVHHACAVDPDARLESLALCNGWPILR